ncbi:hypothetical protein THAOC_23567, partial [Thalassiosira oceanica]
IDEGAGGAAESGGAIEARSEKALGRGAKKLAEIGPSLLATANKLATLSPAIQLFRKLAEFGHFFGRPAALGSANNAPKPLAIVIPQVTRD